MTTKHFKIVQIQKKMFDPISCKIRRAHISVHSITYFAQLVQIAQDSNCMLCTPYFQWYMACLLCVDLTLATILSVTQLQIEGAGTFTQPWKVLDVWMDQCVFMGSVLKVGGLGNRWDYIFRVLCAQISSHRLCKGTPCLLPIWCKRTHILRRGDKDLQGGHKS